jgi:hypothetical protein
MEPGNSGCGAEAGFSPTPLELREGQGLTFASSANRRQWDFALASVPVGSRET